MRKRRLPVIAAALLLPIVSTAAWAGDVSLSETLITKGSDTAVRRVADPGALTGIPTTGGAAAVVVDGSVDGTSFRIKSDYGVDRGGVDGTAFSTVTRRTSLLMLSAGGDFLGGRWTIGKYTESFDDGFYAHVLDFLTDNIASTDFFDYSYRSNGFPALRYSVGDARHTLEAIYSDDRPDRTGYAFNALNPGFNRGIKQGLLVGRFAGDACHGLGLLQKPSDMALGGGASGSCLLGAQGSVYSAVFVQRGSRFPMLSTALYGPDPTGSVFVDRRSSSTFYRRAMVGAQWNVSPEVGVRMEFQRNDSGMTKAQQRNWDLALQADRAITSPAVAADALALDAQALELPWASNLFCHVEYVFPNGGQASVNVLSGLDGSTLTEFELIKPITEHADFRLAITHTAGPVGSEFGTSLLENRVTLGARYFF